MSIKTTSLKNIPRTENIIWLTLFVGVIIITAFIQTLELYVSLALLGSLVLLPIGIILWLHPKWLLWITLILIPFHALITLILVGTLRVPSIIPRLFITWKEVILVAIVCYIGLKLLQTGKLPFKFGLLDSLILVFFTFSFIYILVPSELANLEVKLRGLKVDIFFFLAYFAARSLSWTRRDVKFTLILLFGTGVLAAIAAIGERFLLPGDFLLRMGYSLFAVFQGFDLTDQRFFFTPNSLPASFYGWIGNYLVQRAGSIYVSPLGYAFASLLFISLAYSFFLNAKSFRYKMLFGSLMLLFLLGIALSYTRSALVCLFFSLFISTLWLFRPASRFVLVMILAVLLMLGLLILFIPSNSPINYLFGDSSTQSHIEGWKNSFEVLINYPFGLGLGTAGSVAQKFLGDKGVSNESWYFQLATEMGIPMMLLFSGIVVYWLAICLRIAQGSQDYLTKSFAWGLFTSGVGFSLNGLVLHVWLEPHIALTYWVLVGILHRYAHQIMFAPTGDRIQNYARSR